jgi:ATP-dependent helicase/DNAse subunit B
MPLTLVTGPANAQKAGLVLGAFRARLDDEPLLVVPTGADVEHYRRELAGAGAVFGVRVLTFGGLMGEIGRRAGVRGRALGALSRERIAAAAVAASRLERLASSAATPGFARAFLRLADELEERRIEPGRWYAALRAWAAGAPEQAAYAEELGALYGAYRDRLERLGRTDRALRDLAALDVLRTDPSRWGDTPVFLYGFDDLRPVQLDAVETLAVHAGAEVMVSLTFEPGRVAFAGRGATFQELAALGGELVTLGPADEDAAPALAHLERTLFEEDGAGGPEPDAADAVLLLEGGGERAELELVAAHVARLLRVGGMAPEEIAVVLRAPEERAALVERVFAELGVPVALDRRVAAGRTALGRGLVALLRCALAGGGADDLLAWLRTPGKLTRPELADRLEARARREGAATAAAARALWEADHPDFVLHELDRLEAAHARGPAALLDRLEAELRGLFAAPFRGRAPVLAGPEAVDGRVAAELRRALGELRDLLALDAALSPAPDELARLLAEHEIRVGDPLAAGAVAVTTPLAVRARRVRALFLCGLTEGAFPRPGRPEPFLSDADRRAVNAAGGLRLALRENTLARERVLLYHAVSRPTELLALSWAAAGDDGEPLVRSLFVDDVLDRLGPGLADRVRRRPLGAVGFPAELAPTEEQRRRARLAEAPPAPPSPLGSLRDPRVLASLDERRAWSASALEAYAGCPVRWFVERVVRPERFEPDPEPMVRGEVAHRVLEEALRRLADAGGRLEPAHLDEARALVHAALPRHAAELPISVNRERLRSQLRRLEADLVRYLEHAAHAGSALAPALFELRFGGIDDERPPAPLAGGELPLQGRIDRVDVGAGGPGPREAVVYDYKGASAPPHAKWLATAKLQVGLYVLALEHVLGLEAVGGLYQPLAGREARPRGALRDDADPELRVVKGDRLAPEAFAELLDEVLEAALAAVRGIRAGTLTARPDTCAFKGGCAYPSVCRCPEASA